MNMNIDIFRSLAEQLKDVHFRRDELLLHGKCEAKAMMELFGLELPDGYSLDSFAHGSMNVLVGFGDRSENYAKHYGKLFKGEVPRFTEAQFSELDMLVTRCQGK